MLCTPFGREIFCLYSISMMHPFITSTNANLSFLYFLTAEVLHFYFENLHSLSCVGNFLIN